MQQVKTKGAMCLVAALMACAISLAGCSGTLAVSEAGASANASATNAHSPVIVGEQLGATQGVVITNGIDAGINGVALHSTGSKADPYALSIARTWKKGEDALIFIPVANTVTPSDIILTTEKGEYVLHDVEFPAFAVGEVRLEGKVAYLSFLPAGEAVSTLEHEQYLITKAEAAKQAKAAKAAKKKADAAEAAAKAAAEEAERARIDADAQVQAAWAQAQAQTYYEEPVAETVAEPAANEGTADAQPAE